MKKGPIRNYKKAFNKKKKRKRRENLQHMNQLKYMADSFFHEEHNVFKHSQFVEHFVKLRQKLQQAKINRKKNYKFI